MADQTAVAMTLANLIEERRRQLRLSYRAVAEAGGMKTHRTVHALATTPLKSMPEAATLEGLARGLQLKLEDVTRAAQEACRYVIYETTLPSDPTKRMIISNMEELTPEQLKAVAATVEALRNSNK
ncbi:transcriptional regulator [Micromonospora maritima]|uniref:transcriptional regulator n=1 Tax=Micromonospora maritima TaxID=986711 RepID=UPI00157E0E40|nr:transcriptional regulator [Micromonospora maritima]